MAFGKDWDEAKDAARAVGEALLELFGFGAEERPWYLMPIVNLMVGLYFIFFVLAAAVRVVMTVVANDAIAPSAVYMLNLQEEIRRNSTEGINKVTLAAMSEMFGVEFDAFDLPSGTDRKSVEKRALVVGSKITELLEREFTQGGGLSPEQGEKASKTFTGFSANFAVASAFTGIVGELMTAGQVEAFGEFGPELADNLGLGRMARGGLRELVSTTVATPYDWFMNKKYRPALLSVSGYIEAYWKGVISEDEAREKMRWLGYSEQNIDALIANARPILGDADLSRLERHGNINNDVAVARLQMRGYSRLDAIFLLESNKLLRLDARIEESINFMQTMTRAGTIPLTDFFSWVDTLPLYDEEKQQLKSSMGEIFEHPRKGLTLAQMKDAYIEGVVSLGDYETYLENEGYSFDDADTLIQLLLIDAQREKEKRAAALAAKLKSKSAAVNLGQLRQAFIDGIINIEEWDARLTGFGYSEDDRRILTIQVIIDKAEEDERRRRALLRDEERERKRKEKEGTGEPTP